jgi:hypothetical protein
MQTQGPASDAWATYSAFVEVTTRVSNETFGDIEGTTRTLSESQAEAAARLLREIAYLIGPPID